MIQPTAHPFFKPEQLEIGMNFAFKTGSYKWSVMYSVTTNGKLTCLGCHGFNVVKNTTCFKWFNLNTLKNIIVL